ncbi:MAG TPA: alpha/beta fold hydrolase [Burkholderiales bacterium]
MKSIVLLHGWGMNPHVFDGLRAHLSTRYDVQAFALPAYENEPSDEPCILEAMVAALAARGPARCCVAGWSLGGQLALAWARSAPAQVERLVLLGTSPCFVQRAGWNTAIEARVLQAFAAALDSERDATLKRFLTLQVQGDLAAIEVLRTLRACIKDGPMPSAKTLKAGLKVLLDTDLREALPLIAQDTLVIHGENDALAPVAAGEYLARMLPAGRLVVIRGAAHAPFLSAPDEVTKAVMEFVDD